jgi:hypothetical protein
MHKREFKASFLSLRLKSCLEGKTPNLRFKLEYLSIKKLEYLLSKNNSAREYPKNNVICLKRPSMNIIEQNTYAFCLLTYFVVSL